MDGEYRYEYEYVQPFEERLADLRAQSKWRPIDPEARGRHNALSSALDSAFAELQIEHNDFFDSLVDRWRELFPKLPAVPGRYEDGMIFIYVRSAAAGFVVRPQLRRIAGVLAKLPDAPKKIDLRMEIHAQ